MNIQSITANLGVTDVAASIAFYTSLLDFKQVATVPDAEPFVWAMLQHGSTTIMLQEISSMADEYAGFRDKSIGGTFALYISVTDVDGWHERLNGKASIVVEPHTTFYGAKEFTIQDPNGYILTLAEDTQQNS